MSHAVLFMEVELNHILHDFFLLLIPEIGGVEVEDGAV